METLTVTGEAYHAKKREFKKLLSELGISWCGTIDAVEWRSSGVRVKGEFFRDKVNNLTIKATLHIEGDDMQSIQRLVKWIRSNMNAVGDIQKEIKNRLYDFQMFENFYKPSIEKMKKENAPGYIIARKEKDWVWQRKKKMLELGITEGMLKGIVPDKLPHPIDVSDIEEEKETGFTWTKEDQDWYDKCEARKAERKQKKRKLKYNTLNADAITDDILRKTGHQSKKAKRADAKQNLLAKLKKIKKGVE